MKDKYAIHKTYQWKSTTKAMAQAPFKVDLIKVAHLLSSMINYTDATREMTNHYSSTDKMKHRWESIRMSRH